MAKILSSVMDGKLFSGDDLFCTIETATKSAISAQAEEQILRGGRQNKLITTYYHSLEVSLSMEIQEFMLEVIASKLGTSIESGADCINSEQVILGADGVGTLVGTPVKFNNKLQGWVVKSSERDSKKPMTVEFTEDGKFTIVGGQEGDVYCVQYFITDDNARIATVLGEVSPKCLRFYGYADIFENGEKVGTLELDIPKFLPSPNFELYMEANSTSVMSIDGKCGFVKDENSCDNNGYYCKFIERYFDKKWQDTCTAIYSVSEVELIVGETETPQVLAILSDTTVPKVVKATDLTFSIPEDANGVATVDATGKITAVGEGATELTITVTEKPELKEIINVTVTNA